MCQGQYWSLRRGELRKSPFLDQASKQVGEIRVNSKKPQCGLGTVRVSGEAVKAAKGGRPQGCWGAVGQESLPLRAPACVGSCGLVSKAQERESAGRAWLVGEESGRTWLRGANLPRRVCSCTVGRSRLWRKDPGGEACRWEGKAGSVGRLSGSLGNCNWHFLFSLKCVQPRGAPGRGGMATQGPRAAGRECAGTCPPRASL